MITIAHMKRHVGGENMKNLRKILDLSQSEFAEQLGVSKDLIVSIEIGRASVTPPLDRKIRVAFGASLMSIGYVAGVGFRPKVLPGGRVRSGYGGDYTIEVLQKHRGNFPEGAKAAMDEWRQLSSDLKILFTAA